MEKHKVICPYCGAGCQFNLLVQNGQVVGTEPLNGITNQSELCLKGMSGYDFINDTKILTPRVLHPMIRRTKGADLERVSWDEALDFTASKMQAIIDEYGPNAVMTTGSSRGGGNEANYVMQKFTRACIGTHSVDKINRVLFFVMIAAFILVLALMLPNIKFDNLMAMPIDNALIISASPVFFTAFGFHGSIPSLNKYLGGNVKSLRIAILVGSGITLFAYFLWQLSTHGLLSQNEFLQILREDATLNGLVKATLEITQSPIIANAVKIFSTLALVTSFLGVALGLLECIEDLLKQSFNIHAGRISLGLMTFIPPVLFSLFYPEGFILALGYAGQMFAFYAVVLPVALVWKARAIHPNLPYRVWGGKALLVLVLVLGVIITSIPFAIRAGYLPFVVG